MFQAFKNQQSMHFSTIFMYNLLTTKSCNVVLDIPHFSATLGTVRRRSALMTLRTLLHLSWDACKDGLHYRITSFKFTSVQKSFVPLTNQRATYCGINFWFLYEFMRSCFCSFNTNAKLYFCDFFRQPALHLMYFKVNITGSNDNLIFKCIITFYNAFYCEFNAF